MLDEDTARWRSAGLHRTEALDVVVVDDDGDTLERMGVLFSGEEMRFRGFSRAQDAIDALAQTPADVVVADLCLSNQRGRDLARVLRSEPRHANLRLVAMSDAAEPAWDRVQWFDAYLRKPVDARMIVRLVRELAAAARGA